MIRTLLFIFLFFHCSMGTPALLAQNPLLSNKLIKHVKKTPKEIEKNITALHQYLTAIAENDADRAAVYFLWISRQIRYDREVAMALNKKAPKATIRQTLQSQRAICTGYAQLFAALCQKSDIPCQIINGYTKDFPTSKPDLQESDHAWNAVKVDSNWFLLDVTWAASIAQNPGAYPFRNIAYYFQPPPQQFLRDHLPSDPMWQLVDCPLSPEEFRQSPEKIETFLQKQDSCFSLSDSLTIYEQLAPPQQQLLSLQRAYNFNSTEANAKELGHAYLDQFIRLEKEEDQLQGNDNKALLALYPRLLGLVAQAEKYVTLYDWQKENIAYTHLNFAVALSYQLPDTSEKETTKNILQEMQAQLLKAEKILQSLPPTPFVQRGLDTCREYLVFTWERLK